MGTPARKRGVEMSKRDPVSRLSIALRSPEAKTRSKKSRLFEGLLDSETNENFAEENAIEDQPISTRESRYRHLKDRRSSIFQDTDDDKLPFLNDVNQMARSMYNLAKYGLLVLIPTLFYLGHFKYALMLVYSPFKVVWSVFDFFVTNKSSMDVFSPQATQGERISYLPQGSVFSDQVDDSKWQHLWQRVDKLEEYFRTIDDHRSDTQIQRDNEIKAAFSQQSKDIRLIKSSLDTHVQDVEQAVKSLTAKISNIDQANKSMDFLGAAGDTGSIKQVVSKQISTFGEERVNWAWSTLGATIDFSDTDNVSYLTNLYRWFKHCVATFPLISRYQGLAPLSNLSMSPEIVLTPDIPRPGMGYKLQGTAGNIAVWLATPINVTHVGYKNLPTSINHDPKASPKTVEVYGITPRDGESQVETMKLGEFVVELTNTYTSIGVDVGDKVFSKVIFKFRNNWGKKCCTIVYKLVVNGEIVV